MRLRFSVVLAVAVLGLSGCGDGGPEAGGGVRVAATIGIIADLVNAVGGDLVEVRTVVPANGDPHSYEPSPGDARTVAEADVLFSNGLVLEEQSVGKLIEANARPEAPRVALAERAERDGGSLIPLEEDLGLDVLWLGLAVTGQPFAGEVRLKATGVDGPGDFFVYLTDTFGAPKMYFDSPDGFADDDVVTLPAAAHTHVNWAFTKPGRYRFTLVAELVRNGQAPQHIGTGTYTFAVGGAPSNKRALDIGHTDVAVNPDTKELYLRRDDEPRVGASDVELVAGDAARTTVPADQRFGFLGHTGAEIWILPQAVLGKHVHGSVDPHLWQDVANAQAYVRAIRDTLLQADPGHRDTYQSNADRYLEELDGVKRYVADKLASIPEQNRKLITTHDAFGYLAKANGLRVLGFVVPNPGQEPSAAQVSKLSETIARFRVPAVFIEPNLAARADVLRRVATDRGISICVLYGDAFDDKINNYPNMMRHNADELVRCLGGT